MLKRFVLVVTLALGFAIPAGAQTVLVSDPAPFSDVASRLRRLTPMQLDEVLWLARCVFSEADRANEQRLVAWVVRNRVETQYRGTTYRDVVLERQQFSAFNEPTARREQILAFNQHSTNPLWQQALGIALDVYQAGPSERPLPITTRHFYSPVSMPGGATPHWAVGVEPINVSAFDIDPYRFRFYDQVDTSATAVTGYASAASERLDEHRESTIEARRPARRLSGAVRRPTRPTVERPAVW
jgi:hypothetical protein